MKLGRHNMDISWQKTSEEAQKVPCNYITNEWTKTLLCQINHVWRKTPL